MDKYRDGSCSLCGNKTYWRVDMERVACATQGCDGTVSDSRSPKPVREVNWSNAAPIVAGWYYWRSSPEALVWWPTQLEVYRNRLVITATASAVCGRFVLTSRFEEMGGQWGPRIPGPEEVGL